jgi:ribosomal peptide maturation radical SAM protein 1
MRRVSLVNMPFANLGLPSIALTQLKAVVEEQFEGRLAVEVLYLSHDFAKYLGLEFYDYLTNSMESLNTGLGDWFFRQAAFPELPDNTDKYMTRYFPGKHAEVARIKELVGKYRPGVDAFLDALIDRYKLHEADLVGCTSMFMQNAASFALIRKLKRKSPGLSTVIGGANCEFPMGGVIAERVEEVDFVFSGPALRSFPLFLDRWLAGDSVGCCSIRGVFSKGRSLPKSGPETIGAELSIDTPIKLDYEPFMRRFEEYFPETNAKPVLSIETSRGCWWGERAHCTFCGLNGVSMGYRAMKPDLAIELFNSLFRYSGRVSRLTAVDNILPKNYLHEVLPFLNTPEDMEIFYEVKADLSEQDVAALAKARVTQIQPGIEAMATSTLKLMKKGTTVFQNIKLLKMCALYGITPHWNLLLGFPGEGQESYRKYVETLPLLVHLQPPSGAFPVRFDRFSPYFYESDRYKLNLYPLDFYSLIYPFGEADLKNFAYYFADKNIAAEYFTVMAKWVGKIRSKVGEWQERWTNKALPPRLYFKTPDTIYDSRSAVAVEHVISGGARALLDYLTKPTRIDELIKVFGSTAQQEIDSLHALGLLFQENDRLMSLVLEGEHGSRLGTQLLETATPRTRTEVSPVNETLVQIA